MPFPAKELRLRLFGFERVQFSRSHGDDDNTHYKREEIIMFSFPISNWVDG